MRERLDRSQSQLEAQAAVRIELEQRLAERDRLLVARGQRAQNAHGFMREALPKIKTGKLHAGCGARGTLARAARACVRVCAAAAVPARSDAVAGRGGPPLSGRRAGARACLVAAAV